MRHFSDAEKTRERIELTGFLSELRDALEEEIEKIKKSGQALWCNRTPIRTEMSHLR